MPLFPPPLPLLSFLRHFPISPVWSAGPRLLCPVLHVNAFPFFLRGLVHFPSLLFIICRSVLSRNSLPRSCAESFLFGSLNCHLPHSSPWTFVSLSPCRFLFIAYFFFSSLLPGAETCVSGPMGAAAIARPFIFVFFNFPSSESKTLHLPSLPS